LSVFFSPLLTPGSWLLLVSFLLCTNVMHSEIIDHIMAVVNNRIITLSDVRQEREIRMVLGEQRSNDDKAILKDLIDGALIEEQIAQFPGIKISEEEVERELSNIRVPDSVPESGMREAIGRRLLRLEYFQLRFRQFIRPTDEEIRQYYESVFLPEARNRGLNPIPPLDEVSDLVRKNVVEEKLMHEIEDWLEANRRRSQIEIFD
jgi:hypothetical protein